MKITKLETVRIAERQNLLWILVHTDEGITGLEKPSSGQRPWRPISTNTSPLG